MTNEQTAVMLGGYLEYVYSIKEKADKLPLVIEGKEIEGIDDLHAVIKNVGQQVSDHIDLLNGTVSCGGEFR